MSKETMTMDEAYTCPRCGGQAVNVGAMEQIFDDARCEEVTCMRCNSAWKLYYKMTDFNKKTIRITDTPLDDGKDSVDDVEEEIVDASPVDLNNEDEVKSVEEQIENAEYKTE